MFRQPFFGHLTEFAKQLDYVMDKSTDSPTDVSHVVCTGTTRGKRVPSRSVSHRQASVSVILERCDNVGSWAPPGDSGINHFI